MSQVYLAEHRGSTNWGDRKSNQHKSSQIKCWFLLRGENRSARGKTSWSRVENQQTQPCVHALILVPIFSLSFQHFSKVHLHVL